MHHPPNLLVMTSMIILTAIAGQPLAQASEPPPRRFEISLAAAALQATDISYANSAPPAGYYTTVYSSNASQDLHFAAGVEPGVSAGLLYLLSKRIGLQLLVESFSTTTAARSSPYQAHWQYRGYLPSPPTFLVSESDAAFTPDPIGGQLETESANLNLWWLLLERGRGRWAISGGASWLRSALQGEGLGYAAIHLASHGVAFTETFNLTFRSDHAETLGANLGLEASFRLGRRLRSFIDLRHFAAPAVEATFDVASENCCFPAFDDLRDQYEPTPLKLDPSYSRAALGLQISF
jgi:hypothetical protein